MLIQVISPPSLGTAAGSAAPQIDSRQSAGVAVVPSSVAELWPL